MQKVRKTVGSIIAAASLLAASPLLAGQDIDLSSVDTIRVKDSVVGLGVAVLPDYEGSSHYKAVPVINARVNLNNNTYVGFLGNTLKANLVPDATWNAGPQLRYRPERSKPGNQQVDQMRTVDAAIEVGGFVAYNLPDWTFSLGAGQDIGGGHDGFVIDLGIGYRVKLQAQTMLAFNATSSFASTDYMHTYFSVDQDNSSRSGLPVYNATKGIKDVGLGVALTHNYNRNWGIAAAVKYTRLLNDAADSPVVDQAGCANQILTGLLVNYSF